MIATRRAGSLELDHYIKQLGFVLQTEPLFLYDEFNVMKKRSHDPLDGRGHGVVRSSQGLSDEEHFIGMLLRFSGQITEDVFSISDEIFSEPLKSVYRALHSQYNNEACVKIQSLFETLDEDLQKRLNVLILQAEARNADLSEEVISDEMKKVAGQLIKKDRDHQRAALMHRIQGAQKAGDVDLERKLFQDYSTLFQA